MAEKLGRVAVIGAGYAGMAAAVELATDGAAVTVFEASRSLGGRARAVEIDGITMDNGQHILVGAYRETLRLMQQVSADPKALLLRLPLLLDLPGRLRIAAPDWPAPFHLAAALLGAKGLTIAEKLAATRFMLGLRLSGYRVPSAQSVASLLSHQPPKLRQYLWEPLCLATLNTPPDIASAQVFANVLRDTLGAGRHDADMLLPKVDLSRLFPEPAAHYLESRGHPVIRGERITKLERDQLGWWVSSDATRHGPYDRLILALAPQHAVRLLREHPAAASVCATLDALRYEPIVTVWMQYPAEIRLPAPMIGNGEGLLQWLFDRGQLGGKPGLMAAVISAEGRHLDLAPEALAQRLHHEAAALIGYLPAPRWSRVITEKRATFACTVDLLRPTLDTPLAGLVLAGDYVAGDYPATLEGAVRSGVAAARAITKNSP